MESSLTSLQHTLSNAEDFCVPGDEQRVESLRSLLFSLYSESSDATKKSFGPLPALIAMDDEEGLWEQLQTRTKPLTRFVEKKVKVLSRKWSQKEKKRQMQKQMQQEKGKRRGDNDDDDEDDDEESQTSHDVSDGEEEDEDEEADEEADEEEDERDNELGDDDDEGEEEGHEDQAFGDDVDMEAWLDAYEEMEYAHRDKEERKEKRAKASTVESREWDDEEEGEDDLEFVQNALYADSGEDDNEDEDVDPKSLKYNDFFVDEPRKRHSAKASHNIKDENEDDDVEEEDGDEDFDDFDGEDDYQESDEEQQQEKVTPPSSSASKKTNQFVSSYERRTKELSQQIADLEKGLTAEKSWELRGEVKAGTRPENSLLDVALDVERSTKVAPVITQEYTLTLEDKIIERIKSGKFDDPTSRVSATNPSDEEGPADLSQEKSKVGLGELYAEEYAKKIKGTDDVLNVQTQAVQEEAISLYNEVARQLDALTHFFFTPKPVASEASAKVLATQRSMPALEMEDITPFSQQSSALAAAPEQLLEKKRGKKVTLLKTEELTSEDRKKLRKHKKVVRKAEQSAKEKSGDVQTLRREASKKLTADLKADRRVVIGGAGDQDTLQYGKSSVFFSKLQDDANKHIESKLNGNKRKRENSVDKSNTAVKFKL